jgi:integrase/recombinase XerD
VPIKAFQPDSADNVLRKAMKRVGLIGVSSHSFRRTALTLMSDNHVPLRVIQEVSGHRNLSQLQAYIEVRDDQVLGAVTGLSMLSPIQQSEKYNFFRNRHFDFCRFIHIRLGT